MIRTRSQLTRRVRAAHGDAWEELGRLREPDGGGAAALRDIRVMASGLPRAQWNHGDVTGPDPDLAGAREFYDRRGVPWGVQVPVELDWPHGRHLFRMRLMGLPADAYRRAAPVPGVAVRAAGPEDLDAVLAIDLAAFPGDPELERAWLEPHLHAPRTVTVALAEGGGTVAATAYAVRSDGRAGRCLYLAGVAVAPAFRRRGLGALVSSWLLARGFAAGARLAHLHADTDAAARLYRRLGFVEVGGFDVFVEL